MLVSKGKHIFTFQGVDVVDVDSKYAIREDGKVTKQIWKFTSDRRSEETGGFETYEVLTGLEYGNENTLLTTMIDQMWPDGTHREKIFTNFNKWKGRKFEAPIIYKESGSGEIIVKHLYFVPVEDTPE